MRWLRTEVSVPLWTLLLVGGQLLVFVVPAAVAWWMEWLA